MNSPKPHFNPYDLFDLANSDDYRRQLLIIENSMFTWEKGIEDLFNVLNNCDVKYEWKNNKFTFENALAFIKGEKFGDLNVYPDLNVNPEDTPLISFEKKYSSPHAGFFSLYASFARILVFAKTIHDSLVKKERKSIHNIEKEVYDSLSTDDFHFRNVGKLFVHFPEFIHLSETDRKKIITTVYSNDDANSVFGLFGLETYHKFDTKSELDFYKKLDPHLAELSLHFKEHQPNRFESLERRIALNNVVFLGFIDFYLGGEKYGIDFETIHKDLPIYSKTSQNISTKDISFTNFILENYQKVLDFKYHCRQEAFKGDMEYHGITQFVKL
jgi:hypothetical protein